MRMTGSDPAAVRADAERAEIRITSTHHNPFVHLTIALEAAPGPGTKVTRTTGAT